MQISFSHLSSVRSPHHLLLLLRLLMIQVAEDLQQISYCCVCNQIDSKHARMSLQCILYVATLVLCTVLQSALL